jgi:uncharacterized repeat protein (TIGR02543 family)
MAKRKKTGSKIKWLIPLIALLLIGSVATLYFTDVISLTAKHSLLLMPMNGEDTENYLVKDGETYLLQEPSRQGYDFLGWYLIANPVDILFTDQTVIESDITLYAKWQIAEFDLSLYDFGTVFFTQVSTGYMHTLALTRDGRVFVWGFNSSGQLGNGTLLDKTSPFDITSMFNFGTNEVAVQALAGQSHSVVLTSLGRVFTFGANNGGQLGNESGVISNTPVDITGKFSLGTGETLTLIQTGFDHSSALTSLGRVFTWGNNTYGQLGDGTKSISYKPIDITSGFSLSTDETITKLISGINSQFAYTSQSRIFAWGLNYANSLGTGTMTDHSTPTDVSTTWSLQAGEKVVSITSAFGSTYVVTSLNRLLTWGINDSGQLGNGTTGYLSVPTDIMSKITWQSGETVQNVFSRGFTTFIITSNGRVFACGNNAYYQLGDGTSTPKSTPIEITSRFALQEGETVVQIDSMMMHTIAVTSLGRIFAWGSNQIGQSGLGTVTVATLTPTAHQAIVDVYNFEVEETLVFTFNSEIVLDEPTKFGYTFGGWFIDDDFLNAFNLETMPGYDLHLYPKWNPVY